MSNITLINGTRETVRLAVFQAPVHNPTAAAIAWQVVAPPPGRHQIVEIPSALRVLVRYSSDPDRPDRLDSEATASFVETTASFTIDGNAPYDGHGGGAVIKQTFTDLVLNEVRILNSFRTGVEVSILRGDNILYEPQVIWPGGVRLEDARARLHVALVSPFTETGQRLVPEEIHLTQIEVREGSRLIVTGSPWTGYSFARG